MDTETYEPMPQTQTEYRKAFERIKQANKRLTRELTKLESEIKERCQSYMAQISRMKANKADVRPQPKQILSFQTRQLDLKVTPASLFLQMSGTIPDEIARLNDLSNYQSRKASSTISSLPASNGKVDSQETPIQLKIINDNVKNFRKKYDEELQQTRRSRDSNRLSSCSAESAAPVQQTIEQIRYQYEEEKRITDQKIYVYEAIFCNIYNLLLNDRKDTEKVVEEIRTIRYNELESKLRTLFGLIRINKENVLLIQREKQELLKQIEYLSARTSVMRQEIEKKDRQAMNRTEKSEFCMQTDDSEFSSNKVSKVSSAIFEIQIPQNASAYNIRSLYEKEIAQKYQDIKDIKDKLALTLQHLELKKSSQSVIVSVHKQTIQSENQDRLDDGYTKRSFTRKKIVKKVTRRFEDQQNSTLVMEVLQLPQRHLSHESQESTVTNFKLLNESQATKAFSRFVSSPYRQLES